MKINISLHFGLISNLTGCQRVGLGNNVSVAEMDVTEICPRKPFGFPGEDGSRRSSREEEEEEGRRRVGEEEEEEDEDEDRLDVVGLDEGISPRPGTAFLPQKLCVPIWTHT